MNISGSLSSFLRVEKYNAHQPEYHQAVRGVFTTLWPFLEKIHNIVNNHYLSA